MPALPPLLLPDGTLDWEVLFQVYEFAQFQALADDLTCNEASFVEQALSLADGASVLDLACGAGRHALELGRRGYSVEGVEVNPALVAHAAACAYEDATRVRFATADMRELHYEPQFDAVLVMNSSLGFFDDATNRRVLKSCAESLVQGGRLLLQCINPYRIESYLAGFRTGWYALAGGYVLREARFDPFSANLKIDYRFVAPALGVDIAHPGDSIRLYGYLELVAMIRAAGLRPLTVFGDAVLPAVVFEESSQWQVLVAERI
ncbi:MAG: class I SAM-dependent methyltransferase [Roseiflexaceae bacterium]|nr:class I SAM-dependent methyltransferase [Roseiflexaceae bacterium]